MVKTISTAAARATLGDVLNSVFYTKEPVVVEKKGRPVAVIISPDEYETFRKEREAQAWAAIERVQQANAAEDPDDILAEVTAVVNDVRRERREQQPR